MKMNPFLLVSNGLLSVFGLRKRNLLVLSLILLFSAQAKGQCSVSGAVDYASEVHHIDTTFVNYYADTASFSTAATYQWVFADGTTYYGKYITKTFTELYPTVPATYVLTVSDPHGTSCDTSFSSPYYYWYPFVLQCSAISATDWNAYGSPPHPFKQLDLPDPASAVVYLGAAAINSFYGTTLNLKDHVHINWGNGVSTDTVFDVRTTASYNIGGYGTSGTDTAQSPKYMTGGQYIVNCSLFITLDTLVCPTVAVQPLDIWVSGRPSDPLVAGTLSYCAGDTLRLTAMDTTAHFHSMSHIIDTTGVGATDLYFSNVIYGFGWNFPGYSYAWYAPDGTLVSSDTVLNIENIRADQGGIYTFYRKDIFSSQLTRVSKLISVSGLVVHIDSLVQPTCGSLNGKIVLATNRPGDTVLVRYSRNGADSTFIGIADAAGILTVTGLADGIYDHIHIFRTTGGCGSSIVGPVALFFNPAPTVADSVLSVCTGGSVTLHALSMFAGVTYSWVGPAGFTSSLQNPTVSGVTASGIYTVTTFSGSCPSAGSAIVSLNVLSSVPVVPSLTGPDTLCNRTSLDYGYSVHTSGAAPGGVWSLSDTSIAHLASTYTDVSGISYAAVSGLSLGLETVTYTLTNACGSGYATKNIYFKNGTPVLAPIAGSNVLCLGDTTTFREDSAGGFWNLGTPSYFSTSYLRLDSTTGRAVGVSNGTQDVLYTKFGTDGCMNTVHKTIFVGAPSIIPSALSENMGVAPTDSIMVLISEYRNTSTSPWSLSSTSVGTISNDGLFRPTGIGATIVTYTATNSCGTASTTGGINVGDWINTQITGSDSIWSEVAADHVPAMASFVDSRVGGIATDHHGHVYFSETGIDRTPNFGKIRKIDSNGTITTVAGTAFLLSDGGGYSGDGGAASNAKLCNPAGIACDGAGNIYVCDKGNQVIRKIDASGNISTIAGVYAPHGYTDWGIYVPGGFSGDGGPATAAQINGPTGIVTDGSGNLYFTDMGNFRVRKINSSGIISTVAGNGAYGNTGDGGPATGAAITFPGSIAIDRNGDLLFTSRGYIRKVNAAGIISTFAGSATGTFYDGYPATATAAHFGDGLTVDRSGNIFASFETDIKEIDTNGIIRTAIGSEGWTGYSNFSISTVFATDYPENNFIAADDSGSVYFGITGIYLTSALYKAGKSKLYITSNIDTACYGHPVTFAAKGLNIGNTPSYQWQKNGINVGSDTSVFTTTSLAAGDSIRCLVYNIPGGYNIARSNALSVVVLGGSTSVSAITGPGSVCPGHSISLADSTSGGRWVSSDSTIAIVSSTGLVTGVVAGTDTVIYMVSNVCGASSVRAAITVSPLPVSGTLSGASAVCVGDSTTITPSVTDGAWRMSSSTVATVSAGVVYGVAAGTDTVIYTVSNSCGVASTRAAITINPLPVSGTLSGAGAVCVGDSTTITPSVTGGAWSMSSSTAATVSGGVVNGLAAGIDTVIYTVSNACGAASARAAITVNPLPVSGTLSGAGAVCVGDAMTITPSVTGGAWSMSSSTAATVSGGVVHGVAAGIDTVIYTVSNSCGVASARATITVNPAPNAGTITGADTVCESDTASLVSSALGGTWVSANSAIAVVTSSGRVAGVAVGTTLISYSVTNGCGTAWATHSVWVSNSGTCRVGVTQVHNSNDIELYPNPNLGLFIVAIPNNVIDAQVAVLDASGRVVRNLNVRPAGTIEIPVSLGGVASGVYLVKINLDGAIYFKKIVVTE